MSDRKILVLTLLLTCSPAILAAVILAAVIMAPSRTSGFDTVASRSDCLYPNSGLLPSQSSNCLNAATSTNDLLEVNALTSEDEEQDPVHPVDEPRFSFLFLCSFHKVADGHLITPRSFLSHYPLRS